MGFKQKRIGDDDPVKRKKTKKVKSEKSNSTKVADSQINDIDTEDTAEILNLKTVREGMLLLGCVTSIGRTSFVVSLPGCISGVVEANNISSAFSKAVATADEADLEMLSISSIIEVGMVLPFKVIKMDHYSHKGCKKNRIFLSMKPDDINSNLRPSSLYHKMVLFVSVCSIEDHGFVVNVGTESVQGFLPKHNSDDEALKVGQVIPTFIQKTLVSDKKSAKIQLSRLNFNQEFPKVSAENIKLHSILPGARISADVIDVKKHFVIMKYFDFDVCAWLFYNGSTNLGIQTGNTMEGTVLFVNPITNTIHLALHSTPTPKLFPRWFQFKKFETVKNPKFLYFFKNHAYYKVSKGTYGFINIWDLPAAGSDMAAVPSSTKKDISKACVLSLHYMDKLIQLTAKPSVTQKTIILPDEVNIGDIFDAVVQKHEENGMLVRISLGLYGFVRKLHMADIYVTKPEALFPVGSNVKCRVLSTDGKGKIDLTCKESLLDLHKSCVLSSYDRVQKSQFYKGVVVKICDSYILVAFFNNVKGIVSASHIPPGAVFFIGQTVVGKVFECKPSAKKLKLSLKTEGWCPNKQIKQNEVSKGLKDEDSDHQSSSIQVDKNCKTFETNISKATDSSSEEETVESSKEISFQLCPSNSPKPMKAVIKKVKGHQLNIVSKNTRGRVHITELGCISEGIYPLKEFSSNQKIQVYTIGEYVRKRRNFLEITHRNFAAYKECALKFPPVSFSGDFKCGDSVIGFVKEAYDTCATLWLSPTKTGLLDYLHFSQNPKVVRKLRQHLKIGLSLKVSILDDNNKQSSQNGKKSLCPSLTKIENCIPEAGKNILGLAQITCLDRGLIVKLPFGYHGSVSVTDLTDVYVPAHTLFKKYQKLKFFLCHVLKVDHQTKYCTLSLRKTRLFQKRTLSDSFCPEITPKNIEQGDSVKGFVKFVSDSSVTVTIGRNLEGKLYLHSCSLINCRTCKVSKNVISKYPAGSVIDVVIQGTSDDGKSILLSHSELSLKENPESGRLSVEEDITWEEMN